MGERSPTGYLARHSLIDASSVPTALVGYLHDYAPLLTSAYHAFVDDLLHPLAD